ncbi:restriction endonuclease subunit S [Micrococcus luteus]|uniref:restriction endonuclease subunit S n=1 Tax=Micrococcus luteus TaxID=1270 RepID=UPI00367B2DE8
MSTWTIRRVGDMARLINGHPFDSHDFTPTGDVPLVRIRDITAADFETYVPQHTVPQDKVLKDGDVVIGMDGDFNVIRWRRGAAALNQRVCALRDTGVSDLRFLAYALPDHLKVINDLTYSTTVKHLSSGQVTGLRITAPDRDDQGRIADYLDRETATIDALIEKQRQLSDALRTRRRAAVLARTGFLGVKPASAASSEPWLESAPSHWSRMHVRRLFDLTSGAGFPPELQGVTDEELAFYKVRDLGRTDSYGRLGEPEDTISRETADKLRAKVLPSGTLVMAKIGAALLLGRIRMATRPSCIDNNMLALSPKSLLYPRYATYMLEGLLLDRLVQPGAVPSLNEREFRRTVFPVPPLDEQREIADHLDRETAKIDALIAKAERFIELAQERRSALITAAVTGQIEIPTED